MSRRNKKPASPLGHLVMSLIVLTILSGCFRTPPPQDRDDSVSNTGGPSLLITSPADGAELSGATFFAVQVLRDENVTDISFWADGQGMSEDAPGETQFRRFLIPADYPAGELVLEATAVGSNGRSTTRSVTVQIVPEPPSTGVLGETAVTLGDYEENGALSTVTFPGGAGTGTVTFGTRTQEEIFDLTGVDYDSLGVTFLGAQAIEGADSISRPLGITSGGYGPMVQPGQTVVNYLIGPDADGDGDGDLVVLNGASVAPNGDVVSNPVPRPQVGDTVIVGSSSQLMSLASRGSGAGFLSPQSSVGGRPGTALSFDARGFNSASPLSTRAVFCPEGTDIEYESYVLVEEGEESQTLNVAIPPLPPGPATLRFINETTGYETEVGVINVEAAAPLSAPAAQTIDNYLEGQISALLSLRDQALEIAAEVPVNPEFITQLGSLITSFRGLRSELQKAYASTDPAVQEALDGIAAGLEHSAAALQVEAAVRTLSTGVYPQMTCSEAEQTLSDALDAITMIDATIAAGACVSVLATGVGAAGCLFGAAIFFTGMAIDYTDIIPDCGEEPPPPPIGPPGGGPGGGGAGSWDGGVGGSGGGWFTGMGGLVARGGVVAGSIAPGAGTAPTSSPLLSTAAFGSSATSVLPDFAGRYRIAVSVEGETNNFSGLTDTSGYFYIPSVPAGERYIATATDVLTGASREIRGTGPVVGDSQYLTFDFGPVNAAPVAVSGGNRAVTVGDTIVLDATSSYDPNDDPLAYSWKLVTAPIGSSASIDGGSNAMATLTIDVAGTYEVELTVDDGLHEDSDVITISASEVGTNGPPVVDAGADQQVDLGDVVSLDGSSSFDPDGDALSYLWTLSNKPAASSATLASSTARTSFTPDVAGSYTAQLTVSDGIDSSSASVVVIVSDPATVIDFGGQVFESIADEVDSYSFSGEVGQLAVIYAVRAGSDLIADVELSLAGGGVLDNTTFGSEDGLIALRLPETGQYLVEVDAHNGLAGTYSLNLQEPSPITVDSNVSGMLAVDERKFYSFEGIAGTRVKTTTLSETTMVNRILDLEGNLVTQSIGTIPADGTYLLMIAAPNGGAAYTSGLALIEPTVQVGYGRYFDQGMIEVVGDVRYYRVSGMSGDGVHLSLRKYGATPLPSGDLRFTYPDGSMPPQRSASGYASAGTGAVVEEIGSTLSVSGDYLVVVDGGSSHATGGYELRIDVVAAGSAITVDDDLLECSGADSQSLTAALLAIAPGGMVDVCDGTYQEVLSARLDADGVTVKGRTPANAVLAGLQGVPLTIEADLVTIEDLTLQGNDVELGAAVDIEGGTATTFRNVTVRPHPNQASLYRGIQNLGSDSVVEESTFTDAGTAIYLASAGNILITGNLFQGNSGSVNARSMNPSDPLAYSVAITENRFELLTANSINLDGSGHLIENNVFEVDGSRSGTVIGIDNVGEGPDPTSIIRGNTINIRNSDYQTTALDITLSGGPADLLIERNLISFDSSPRGGIAMHMYASQGSATLRNNIFRDTSSFGVQVERVERLDGLSIVNNSFRIAAGAYSGFGQELIRLESFESPSGNLPVTIVNNVFQGVGEVAIATPAGTTIDSDYNLFYKFSSDYSGGTTSTGANDISDDTTAGDPLFVDLMLSVSPSSPAVDAGADDMTYPIVPAFDYDLTSRPGGAGVDIGAHEQ